MARNNTSLETADRFDGIIDNKAPTLPKAAVILFLGLIVWGLFFCGYYLFSGWNSAAEFEKKMKAVQPSSAPASGVAR